MNGPTASLAVVLLTYNEALHIDRALNSIASIATQVFVVDSGSTDGTVEMAEARGATVLHNPWTNHAIQFQWGLDNAPITADWVMRLDADEIIEPDLAAEITARLNGLPSEVTGVNLKRKHIFMGRWVRHGGRYPLVMLRLWRRGQARVEQRWMDEHILLLSGKAVTFEGGFADHNLNDLTFFTEKHNKYATLEAVDVINQRRQLFSRDIGLRFDKAPGKAAWTRLIKEKIYNRIPFQVSALGYFLYRYIFQLGFLDGREGAIYHVLQGFWYRYLVGAKVVELEAAIEGLSPLEAKAKLSKLTGLKLG
jgi:glycosyltransferase involved in cell wall biosynthesis